MAGINDLACADSRCGHPFGQHTKTDDIRQPGRCRRTSFNGYTIGHSSRCACQSFVWEPYEEDPDRAWDDYKAGYTDIDGNVVEPLIDEPEDY
jgi:hypothetical protein